MPTAKENTPARLIAIMAGVTPDTYTLGLDYCILGRAPSCHLIVRHALVSRNHARIERDHQGYTLIDTGSANGTFVNNIRIKQPHRLRDRDVIGLGNTTAAVQFVVSSFDAQNEPYDR